MEAQEAFRKGFRIAWSHRRVVALEIAWRWGFWAAVGALGLATLALWLDSVPLSSADIRNLRSGPPWLVGVTLVGILSTAADHARIAFVVSLLGAFLMWWFVGSAVRARIGAWLLGDLAKATRRATPRDFGAMLAYHAAWFLVTGLCLLIANSILARVVFRPGSRLFLSQASFLSGAVGIAAILLFWQFLSWLLCLGCSYAICEETDLLAGLGLSVSHLGESLVDFLAFSTTFFLLRCAAFLIGWLLVVLLSFLPDWDRGTAVLVALPLAALFVSIPCRFLATAQSAGYLALTRKGAAPAWAAPGELPS